ncbi:MAG: NUDIX domain-containing protein [Actinobacteria bacterium]|nr:NUDIX domain-containing protein [Actinomycetota bacterium]
MGGPFWARKDDHAWSIPKGLVDDCDADLLATAEREFEEEMGSRAPPGPSWELGEVRRGSKTIVIFAREGDFDAAAAVSNTFEMEWPPRSGRMQEVAEIDRADWMSIAAARTKLVKGQQVFLDRLIVRVSDTGGVAN